MEHPPSTQNNSNPQVLKVLELLKQASHDLQTNPNSSESDSIKALLELQTESDSILSTDPYLSTLSTYLSQLKTLVHTLQNTKPTFFTSFLTRRVSAHSISKLAKSIESEIQAWIDRESINNLSRALHVPLDKEQEHHVIKLLSNFEERVLQGFNLEFQDLVLKSRVFSSLESVLCNEKVVEKVREHCAFCIAALIRFNKDVFVGQVLMGPTVQALISMGSRNSIRVLCALIKKIKSPLVDEIESNGEILKIISFLDSDDFDVKVAALDCVLEIGYFGRREAVEAMFKEGLIEKLVELQRCELGGDLVDMGRVEEGEEEEEEREKRYMEGHPFASCVARFAVQLEVGEGLRQREKRAFKQEVLVKVREASVSDAEAATIVAEVLWGSSP